MTSAAIERIRHLTTKNMKSSAPVTIGHLRHLQGFESEM